MQHKLTTQEIADAAAESSIVGTGQIQPAQAAFEVACEMLEEEGLEVPAEMPEGFEAAYLKEARVLFARLASAN